MSKYRSAVGLFEARCDACTWLQWPLAVLKSLFFQERIWSVQLELCQSPGAVAYTGGEVALPRHIPSGAVPVLISSVTADSARPPGWHFCSRVAQRHRIFGSGKTSGITRTTLLARLSATSSLSWARCLCFCLVSLIPEFPAPWKRSDRLSRNSRIPLQSLFYLCNCTQMLKAETAAILIQHSLSIPEVTKQVQDVLMKSILLFLKHRVFCFPHS